MRRRSLLNDVVFKIVFGTQRNERLLRAFINAVLGLEGDRRIQQLFLINAFGDKLHYKDRGVILDVKAVDGLGRRFNVEVQLRKKPDYAQRSIYYTTRYFNEQLEKGSPFGGLQRTVGISILDFRLFDDDNDYHHSFRLHCADKGLDLSDILELHYLELPKLMRKLPLEPTELEKWLHLLKFAGKYAGGQAEIPPALREEEMMKSLEEMQKAYGTTLERELEWAAHKAHHDEVTWLAHIAKLEEKAEIAELKATIAELKAENTLLRAEIAESRAMKAESRAETAESRAETAESRAETAESRAESAESRAESAENRLRDVQAELDRLRGSQ